MRNAAKLETFRQNPAGSFLAGQSWVHWCARPGLFGVTLWGRPQHDDIGRLAESLKVELERHVAPHASVVDTRRVQSVDPDAFEALQEYVRLHHAALSAKVTRLALVRPSGMPGAVVAGFFQVLKPPYPTQVVDNLGGALRWVGESESMAQVLDGLVAGQTGVDPLLSQLRTVLETSMGNSTLEDAAQALQVAPRTLQRRLEGWNTSFQNELVLVRLEVAKRRMLDTDAPLTAVALDAGFSSPQHFSTQFRKQMGISPSAWRQRRGISR